MPANPPLEPTPRSRRGGNRPVRRSLQLRSAQSARTCARVPCFTWVCQSAGYWERQAMTRLIAVALFSIAMTGCGREMIRWYKPSGAGITNNRNCGGPKQVMKFQLDQGGTTLSVSIDAPNGEREHPGPKPNMNYGIALAPGSRVRIMEPAFVILSITGEELRRYPFSEVSGPGFKSIPATEEFRATVPADTNKKKARVSLIDNYFLVSLFIDELPPHFQVRYPTLMVNDKFFAGPTVTYTISEGSFLIRRCFTGT
jgi:hypothetical protein